MPQTSYLTLLGDDASVGSENDSPSEDEREIKTALAEYLSTMPKSDNDVSDEGFTETATAVDPSQHATSDEGAADSLKDTDADFGNSVASRAQLDLDNRDEFPELRNSTQPLVTGASKVKAHGSRAKDSQTASETPSSPLSARSSGAGEGTEETAAQRSRWSLVSK